ncbi:GroES-like protein [Hypoxylon fuscum]|nr:GroES-like protein [Hypoxylon fuscum]
MPKQVIVQSSIEAVEFIETPIPSPSDKQVVIKVVVSGTNPKDWKYPHWKDMPLNSGDDIAGIVHSVGKDVYEFKPGDRVAGLHEFLTENGSFAEYAVAPDWTTFHIPQNISFEEAATIPTAALTAAIALYVDMKLPALFDRIKPREDGEYKVLILIYGVTKFARLSGLGPVIGVAGRASAFAKTLVDHVVDYRGGEDALVAAVSEILTREGLGNKIPYVFDAISENGSLEATLRPLDQNGSTVNTLLPPKLFAKDRESFKYPPGMNAINTAVPRVHSMHKDFGYLWSRYLGRLLEDGRLTADGTPLRDGPASGVKYVYRIKDTGEVAIRLKGVPVGSRQNLHPLGNFPH